MTILVVIAQLICGNIMRFNIFFRVIELVGTYLVSNVKWEIYFTKNVIV